MWFQLNTFKVEKMACSALFFMDILPSFEGLGRFLFLTTKSCHPSLLRCGPVLSCFLDCFKRASQNGVGGGVVSVVLLSRDFQPCASYVDFFGFWRIQLLNSGPRSDFSVLRPRFPRRTLTFFRVLQYAAGSARDLRTESPDGEVA